MGKALDLGMPHLPHLQTELIIVLDLEGLLNSGSQLIT